MNSQKNSKGKFINPGVQDGSRSLWQVLLWFAGYYKDPDAMQKPPENFVSPPHSFTSRGDGSLIWIGHSTFLIQRDGINILTDPVWAKRASPFRFFGPKRQRDPGLSFEALPSIDYVLISHNHYDHLDLHTCRALYKKNSKVVFIVPLGLKKWFLNHSIPNVEELDWWQKRQSDSIQITAVASQHFSGRAIFDRNKSLWCGYVLQFSDKCLYYAADTGYNQYYFTEIAKRFTSIDMSIIPIGAYAPRDFMKAAHVTPKEALQIHRDVRSKLSIGCHYGTFMLADEPLGRPPYDLYLARKEYHDADAFYLMEHGQKISF